MSKSIDTLLDQRGERYGDFAGHAVITQEIKGSMKCTNNWPHLTASMRESLEMIAHKIGRILNGDPSYVDSWTDIAGYARLVEQELLHQKGIYELTETHDEELEPDGL